jgi:uncharacterized protein YjbI with pentapeptide repeats
MADEQHLAILAAGTAAWNAWREANPGVTPDLRGADLRGANLTDARLGSARLEKADLRGAILRRAHCIKVFASEADLSGADLSDAYLAESGLHRVNFRGANLSGAGMADASMHYADLTGAKLVKAKLGGIHASGSNFSDADLTGADLTGATLNAANLSRALLTGAGLHQATFFNADLDHAVLDRADLSSARFIDTRMRHAKLRGCRVYGVSVWHVDLEGAEQVDLVITPVERALRQEPVITVDNLEVAQFLYLLLNNQKLRETIRTITTKCVLILGRFTPERKAVLDAIRDALRKHNYLPVLFDFEGPAGRSLTETVSTLAHLARFIIADISDPRSIPKELQVIVPTTIVPVQPILERGQREFGMFGDLRIYDWVLPTYCYDGTEQLLASLVTGIIAPAERKAEELEARKRR